MTPTIDNDRHRRIEIRADGSSTIWRPNSRARCEDREDFPAEQLPTVRRYCSDGPHVVLLDQIETDLDGLVGEFPELRRWTRSRHHYLVFAVLHLRCVERLVNVMTTPAYPERREKGTGRAMVSPATPAAIVVADPTTRESRRFKVDDLNAVYAAILQVICG